MFHMKLSLSILDTLKERQYNTTKQRRQKSCTETVLFLLFSTCLFAFLINVTSKLLKIEYISNEQADKNGNALNLLRCRDCGKQESKALA